MKKERIITRRWGDRRKGKTDWKRFGAITDAEVEASIANDPDWAEFKDIDWSDAVLVMPAKKLIQSLISVRFWSRTLQRPPNEALVQYSVIKTSRKPQKRAKTRFCSLRITMLPGCTGWVS